MNLKKAIYGVAVALSVTLGSCSQEEQLISSQGVEKHTKTGQTRKQAFTSWISGSTADVQTTTTGGTVLMGGGTDVDAAFRWMISKSGGGDFVVIRATGTEGYNEYVYTQLGGVNSCETILIDSRTVANDPAIEQKIRNAEAVFISGGNQANYVNFWEGTLVENALNYLINTKKVPVGGTSAGCAIQGKVYFSAVNGTITSADAIANPYNSMITLGRDNFLSNSYLSNTITDTHFNNPDRRGRLITFMARMNKDWAITNPKGVGVDEATAVCIDANGQSKVFGTGTAFFLSQNTSSGGAERCISGSSLDWYRNRQAIRVYKVAGTTTGTGTFNFATWSGSGGSLQYYYVDRGVLGISY